MKSQRLAALNTLALYLILVMLLVMFIWMITNQFGLSTMDFYNYVDNDTGVSCYVLKNSQAMWCYFLEGPR